MPKGKTGPPKKSAQKPPGRGERRQGAAHGAAMEAHRPDLFPFKIIINNDLLSLGEGFYDERGRRENTLPNPIPGSDPIVEPTPGIVPTNSAPPEIAKRIHIYLYNEEEAEKYAGEPFVSLDYIPEEVEVNPSSFFKSLNIVGLNYPRYHYGGGEDIVTFTIQWFGVKDDKDSVISKCRKVEALTKANGWINGPPEVIIKWDHPGVLFEKHIFIVEKAGYKLRNFMVNKTTPNEISNLAWQPFGSLPIVAEQKITLKRVGSHLTWDEIIYPK